MGKKIAIILGAGASYDVIPDDQRGRVVKENAFRPPLTHELTSLDSSLEKIIHEYPKAYTALSWLRRKLLQGKFTLEELLTQLRDSPELSRQLQFREMSAYLQDLFYQISMHYCRIPVNYSEMVSETLRSDVEKVAYITLNYDLLLDIAISTEDNFSFENINNYVRDEKKWFYVKLHGSANWGRKIKPERLKSAHEHLRSLLHNIAYLNPETDLEEIEIDHSIGNRPNNTNLMFPAITVPIDAKYEFNCPTFHIEKLKSYLGECKDYLFIGTSARDDDLIDLLKSFTGEVRNITFVGGANTEENAYELQRSVPQFGSAGWAKYVDGFTKFVQEDGFERFLDDCS